MTDTDHPLPGTAQSTIVMVGDDGFEPPTLSV